MYLKQTSNCKLEVVGINKQINIHTPGDSYVVPFCVVYHNPQSENRSESERNYMGGSRYVSVISSGSLFCFLFSDIALRN